MVFLRNAAGQALTRKYTEFYLGHVQPATVLWGVMDSQLSAQSACFGRFKDFVEHRQRVRVQVVHHHPDALGVRVPALSAWLVSLGYHALSNIVYEEE